MYWIWKQWKTFFYDETILSEAYCVLISILLKLVVFLLYIINFFYLKKILSKLKIYPFKILKINVQLEWLLPKNPMWFLLSNNYKYKKKKYKIKFPNCIKMYWKVVNNYYKNYCEIQKNFTLLIQLKNMYT